MSEHKITTDQIRLKTFLIEGGGGTKTTNQTTTITKKNFLLQLDRIMIT